MGYGHLRAAQALATALGTTVAHADRPPLSGPEEERLWRASRRFYEVASRSSQLPLLGIALRSFLDRLTAIPPLYPYRDLSAPTMEVQFLDRLIRKGLGTTLAAHLQATGAPLLTTYFATALMADHHGAPEVHCLATDVDLNRAWVSAEPWRTHIHYLTPSRRALKRLVSYGVPREQIEFTGFPLPHELVGGKDLPILKRNLAARLVRLDRKGYFRAQTRNEIQQFLGPLPAEEEGRPPLAVFAVGGAGAQADLARHLLPSLKPLIEEGKLRLCLVAGVRPEVAARFATAIEEAGLAHRLGERVGDEISILFEPALDRYFPRFNELLAATDLLLTKPSELVFFGALGLPLVLSRPVGIHEGYNRRWAIENGAGLKMRDPRHAGWWIREWLSEGVLAAAAWFGFLRLPKFGLYQILEAIGSSDLAP
jgi:hypothetical protein